jgi:hypothetical protein
MKGAGIMIKISSEVGYKIVEINGKDYHIPQKEIDQAMQSLEISEQEAIEMWLDDNDITTNEQVEELTKKAKANKTTLVNAGKKVREKKVERERKANPVKEEIVEIIAKFLENYQNLPISSVNVENIGKIITFKVENREFKLDLVEKRQKKA